MNFALTVIGVVALVAMVSLVSLVGSDNTQTLLIQPHLESAAPTENLVGQGSGGYAWRGQVQTDEQSNGWDKSDLCGNPGKPCENVAGKGYIWSN